MLILMPRCAMPPGRDARYAFYFRWGSFQLSLTGRGPMLVWAGVILSLLGLKVFWPIVHTGWMP